MFVCAAAVLARGALAHGVEHSIGSETLTVITLRTSDGHPLADARYEVRLADTDASTIASGRTDAAGRAAIVPQPGRALDVRVATEDGHGALLRLPPALPVAQAVTAVVSEQTAAPPFSWRDLLTGLALIFGIFGLLQLRTARRPPPEP